MPYRHLSIEERETIDRMHYSGCPQSKIADALKRSPSTISRELSRNRTGYSAHRAQCDSERRRRERPIDRKLDNPELNAAVRSGLAHEWSPEQIAGHQRTEYREDRTRHVSHQTIDRWLERGCPHRSHFESFLRHGRYGKRALRETGSLRSTQRPDRQPRVHRRASRGCCRTQSLRRLGRRHRRRFGTSGRRGDTGRAEERLPGRGPHAGRAFGKSESSNPTRAEPAAIRPVTHADSRQRCGVCQARIAQPRAGHADLLCRPVLFQPASSQRKHQRPAASVLPQGNEFPGHHSPGPCQSCRQTEQST